ncbi:MAG: Fic family protein [Chromatiales bacterium]|nr:Fic family protein [Chromatiales bacterium]
MKKAHIPEQLPLQSLTWNELLSFISRGHRGLAYFDALLQNLPDANLLLSPLEMQEATLSSRIEGTQATLDEVLRFQAGGQIETEKRDDIQEVINYRAAVVSASKDLESLKLSGRVLKKAHRMLLSGVRGKNKTPGEFRTGPVFVGPLGGTREQASYIPPDAQHIEALFSNLEKYMNDDEKDVLVQAAIVHAQFEIIHPFWDGNGRIGRLLIPLFLYSKGIISAPCLYLSEYLEAHRDDYYKHLNNITTHGNWQQWIIFFLKAVIAQSQRNAEKAQKIINIKDELIGEIQQVTHSQYITNIVYFIIPNPIFTSSQLNRQAKIPRPSIARLLLTLERAGIISKIYPGRGRRPSLYAFEPILEAIE